MSKLAIVAATLPAVSGGGQAVFAEEAMSEPRCIWGLSIAADVSSAGRATFFELPSASANERNLRIDGLPLTPSI